MGSEEGWSLNSTESKNYLSDSIKLVRRANVRLQEENAGRRNRDPWNRDLTRILYSTSFRRLQNKMQLLGIDPENFYRNRLTHSLEVSQIARSIAIRTRVYGHKPHDELQVVQAAALAHDIGNPPFGHCGEAILDELNHNYGGFEGNAQTLRILMQLEKKNPTSRGLNLTLRSLLGVTKYFVKRGMDCDKFIYDDDYDKLAVEINRCNIILRTLDVQAIDIADEIAYGAHDLEDALSMKLFGIDEFLFEFRCWTKGEGKSDEAYDALKKIVHKALEFAQKSSNLKSSEEYHFLLRKELTGILVHSLIRDVGLVEPNESHRKKTGTQQNLELGFLKLGDLAKGLKKVTFICINRANKVQLYEKRAELIINDLFKILSDKSSNKDFLLLPPEYRPCDHEDQGSINRSVIDYIAGMMDTFAISLHKKFVGDKPLFNT